MGAEAEENGQKQHQDSVRQNPNPIRITESQFLHWKRQKDADTSARKAEAVMKRSEDIVAGLVPMNGRELFQHEPWVFDNSRY